jgi:hypothetical protein
MYCLVVCLEELENLSNQALAPYTKEGKGRRRRGTRIQAEVQNGGSRGWGEEKEDEETMS